MLEPLHCNEAFSGFVRSLIKAHMVFVKAYSRIYRFLHEHRFQRNSQKLAYPANDQHLSKKPIMKPSDFREHGHFLIGATGAVSVVNLPGYIVHLRQNVCKNIKVILTEAACTFIRKEAILYVSGNEAFVTGSSDIRFPAPHLSLTNWADIFLILPASGNIIGKAANGIADDLLSSAFLAAGCPVVFYPSTNKRMWEKPAMKRNIATIVEDGYYVKYKIEKCLEVATGEVEENIVSDILNIGRDIYQILKDTETKELDDMK